MPKCTRQCFATLKALLLFMTVCLPLTVKGDMHTFQLKRGIIRIDLPQTWQSVEGLYGMPLQVLGPSEKGRRPVIAFVAFGKSETGFDLGSWEIFKNPAAYREGREQWLKNFDGIAEAFSYFPYKKSKWQNVSEVHSLGYAYRLGSDRFEEQSHYLICKKGLFHAKAIIHEGQQDQATTIQKILESFTCE